MSVDLLGCLPADKTLD
jgi:LisH domain-containing protein ARMC9